MTGNYPGKAGTDELQADLEQAGSLIPGQAPPESSRQLCRVRRQEGRA